MYSSRGSNAYGQQPYGSQSAYGQNLGPGYSGSSVGLPETSSHVSLSSRHSSMLGASQEAEVGGYRSQTSAGPHYGGQYSSVYGSTALTGAQQVPAINIKGAGSSALEGRGGYTSAISDSPKFASGDYVSTSSLGYGHKGDQIYAEKIPDYSTMDRRVYGERQSTYLGRDLQSESTGRFADAVGYGHQNQPEIYDRLDQTSLLRQEQLLKAQSLQSSSLDGGTRQADYLATRGPASHHSTQDLLSFGGRMEADPRNMSMLSSSAYGGHHAPSILGAAPRRNVDDHMYPQSSSNPGYGVSLPPGRNYATGKGLHATAVESDYPGSMFSRSSHPSIDECKDDRASYLREFELREEERRREYLREREKEREREKDRERERERERQRQRERERERERMLERREKERERERKRAIEIKRERTPPRVSKDPRGPSLTKEGRSFRRDSPRHEALHRRHSPGREKRREYVCKVNSSSFVDVERDYLSLDKRYPRLFVSPDVSKVVVNWLKEELKLSIHTPVSFEHDFVEEDSGVDPKVTSYKLLTGELADSEQGSTVWNAKLILMSGLSRSAVEELSSEKSFDDRVPHICNILRFAVLKKDHSFMAIGGPWNSVDGSDPSVDSSSLVQTAIRYAKDVTQLDLQDCHNWNRFFEIHYDRVGKDGLFSHKEVTVYFVPDLSECLPSLDTWRTQWLAHKKAVAERERQLSMKMERSKEKKDGQKDKEMDTSKDVERTVKSEKKKGSPSSGEAVKINEKEKSFTDLKGNATNQKGNGSDKKFEKIDGIETGREEKNVEEKDLVETAAAQTAGNAKPGKRKIIRRIVKQKVVDKAAGGENTDGNQNDKLDKKDAVEKKNANSEVSGHQEEPSIEPAGVKTFTRKKVSKKTPEENPYQNDNKGIQPEVKAEEMDQADDKPKDDSVLSGTAAVQDTGVKTTIKKKIIKRVLKRKVTGRTNDAVVDTKIGGNGDQKSLIQLENKTEDAGTQMADTEKKTSPEMKSKSPGALRLDVVANSSKTEIKVEKDGKKAGMGADVEYKTAKEKVSLKDSSIGIRGNSKDGERSKDEKPKNEKDGKVESRSHSNKEGKEKRKPDEPPRHPGLILRTKSNKDYKLRSLSLSLDSLLEYTDKDIEESSFELSLFGEILYEMLQHQMGCRVLEFLQRLRIKFLSERNERKRQRSEVQEKENDKKSPKRSKIDELPAARKSTTPETTNSAQPDDKKTMVKEDTLVDHVNEAKIEETEDEEDPEEDPEEDEEMRDASSQPNSSNGNDEEEGKTDANAQPGTELGNEKDKANESNKEKTIMEAAEVKHTDVDMGEKGERKVETGKKEVFDKELLQAFRFFDRNQVGYIRVEDLRLIIHNLGKFLSHRDVKELVQSALLESNTGRDDRILYNKLVRMPDI